jgi:hypothetical protein
MGIPMSFAQGLVVIKTLAIIILIGKTKIVGALVLGAYTIGSIVVFSH